MSKPESAPDAKPHANASSIAPTESVENSVEPAVFAELTPRYFGPFIKEFEKQAICKALETRYIFIATLWAGNLATLSCQE